MFKPVSTMMLAVVLASSVSLVGCDKYKSGGVEQDSVLRQGAQLFTDNCSKCHPRTGRGDYLKRIPATMLTKKSADELKVWIRGVGQHREMPSFETMNEEQLNALTAYLKKEITR